MPLIRKIIDVGKTSRAVIIPKSWLKYYERELGHEIIEVYIETDGMTLKISPAVTKKVKS